MERIITYGRWILLAVGILAAGFCYSCTGQDRYRSEPVQKEEKVNGEQAGGRVTGQSGSQAAGQGAGQTAGQGTGQMAGQGTGQTAESMQGQLADSAGNPDGQEAVCWVYVCGQVQSPGVYRLAEGSRIADAVEKAGGFTEKADPEWMNLAEKICDGMKIRIPDREEVQQMKLKGFETVSDGGCNGTGASGKVNINTAGLAELMTLPGIGSAKAEAIRSYREQHGSFRTIEDIMQVPGIKDAAFQKIRDHIMVSG